MRALRIALFFFMAIWFITGDNCLQVISAEVDEFYFEVYTEASPTSKTRTAGNMIKARNYPEGEACILKLAIQINGPGKQKLMQGLQSGRHNDSTFNQKPSMQATREVVEQLLQESKVKRLFAGTSNLFHTAGLLLVESKQQENNANGTGPTLFSDTSEFFGEPQNSNNMNPGEAQPQ